MRGRMNLQPEKLTLTGSKKNAVVSSHRMRCRNEKSHITGPGSRIDARAQAGVGNWLLIDSSDRRGRRPSRWCVLQDDPAMAEAIRLSGCLPAGEARSVVAVHGASATSIGRGCFDAAESD